MEYVVSNIQIATFLKKLSKPSFAGSRITAHLDVIIDIVENSYNDCALITVCNNVGKPIPTLPGCETVSLGCLDTNLRIAADDAIIEVREGLCAVADFVFDESFRANILNEDFLV